MKRLLLLPALLLLAGCSSQVSSPTRLASPAHLDSEGLSTPPSNSQTIGVPLYQYPLTNSGAYNTLWKAVVDTQKKTGRVSIVVVDVNSGPYNDGAVEPNFVPAIKYLQAGGIEPYGYVDSNYAEHALADVERDVDRWVADYGVGRIFVDQVSTDCGDAKARAYYAALSAYIRAKGSSFKIILNPGTVDTGSECLMKYGDTVATFESTATAYNKFQPPAWTANYAPERFWHIVHTIKSQVQQTQLLTASRSKRAGVVDFTSDTMANPYDKRSKYWDAFGSQVGGS